MRNMLEGPQLDTYSIPECICLGIAIFGAMLLAVAVFSSTFLLR
jgi:hypothetical protein